MGHRKFTITIFTTKEYIVLIQTHDINILFFEIFSRLYILL